MNEWSDPSRVSEYLSREIPFREVAEELLLKALPGEIRTVLDLGVGDGRLLGLVLDRHPGARGVGLDASEPMLERARERFGMSPVELRRHDLGRPLSALDRFDAVVSGLAIHHLDDSRKRVLFAEVHDLLHPGGAFLNLDLVASATPLVHRRFREEIGRARDDESDRLASLCDQLEWLRAAEFETADCHFKWLELALIVASRES